MVRVIETSTMLLASTRYSHSKTGNVLALNA